MRKSFRQVIRNRRTLRYRHDGGAGGGRQNVRPRFFAVSLLCPRRVGKSLGTGPDGVHVLQDVTGGGFGGKEDYPSILGCQVAVAAHKAKAPVRCVFDRREDMEFTPKRHPSICKYKMAVKNGRVTAVDCDVIFDAGAYSTLSAVVLQRGIIAAPGVYDIPNVHVTGRALQTNTVPCGAYRGFALRRPSSRWR